MLPKIKVNNHHCQKKKNNNKKKNIVVVIIIVVVVVIIIIKLSWKNPTKKHWKLNNLLLKNKQK